MAQFQVGGFQFPVGSDCKDFMEEEQLVPFRLSLSLSPQKEAIVPHSPPHMVNSSESFAQLLQRCASCITALPLIIVTFRHTMRTIIGV